VLKSGTLGDKISALTMRCKESPVHRLADLDKLVEMATKHDRRTAQVGSVHAPPTASEPLICSCCVTATSRWARGSKHFY
jgi:hypothetical protein